MDMETQSLCDIRIAGGRRYAYDPSTKLISLVALIDNTMVVWIPNGKLHVGAESLWPEQISPKLPVSLFTGPSLPQILARTIDDGRPLRATTLSVSIRMSGVP